VPHCSTIIWL